MRIAALFVLALAAHAQTKLDIVNQTSGNLPGARVSGTVTPAAHVHAAADTTSGVFAIGRLATGTPDGTKFVRDDGTLAVPAGGGGVTGGACSAGQYTISINTSGVPTCSVVNFTQLGGTATKAQQHASTVYFDAGNTYTTGTQDFSLATAFLPKVAAGYAPTTNGHFGYDSTAHRWVGGTNGALVRFALQATGTPATDDCAKFNASGYLVSAGAACGSGSAAITRTAVSFSATPVFARTTAIQQWTMTLTGDVTSSTTTGLTAGDLLSMEICQDATGSRTFSAPTGFSNMGIIDSGASRCSVQTFKWDGSAAVPDSVMIVIGGAAGSAITMNGSTSGTMTIQPPAVAGAAVVTGPGITGTIPVFPAAMTASRCVEINGAGTGLVAAAAACGAGIANYEQTFTAQTTVVLAHSLASTKVLVGCYDNTAAPLAIGINSVALTDSNNVTVTFTTSQTGKCVVNAGGGNGDALVANTLSQFAATTSAQLAGVLSNETGSGAAVFATSPTLVTPALGTPSSAVLTNATGYPYASLTGIPSTFAPSAHNHAATDITSGTMALARLAGITDVEIAAANKDGTAGTASMRTLGAGAAQAASGTDARLSDTRTPTDATVTLAKHAALAANSIIGNNTGGAATPIALTVAQTKTLLAIAAGDVSGLAASATTDTTNATNIASGTLSTARNSTAVRTRQLTFMLGAENGSVVVDGDDQPTIAANRSGGSWTITEVFCESDAGTPSINLQRDDGTPADVLSANLSCSTSGATGTLAGAETTIANGDKIDFVMVTAGGVAKRATVVVTYTLN